MKNVFVSYSIEDRNLHLITVLMTLTVRTFELQRRVSDALLTEHVFQRIFHCFHVFQLVNGNVCCQGVVGSADCPDVQVVYVCHMLCLHHVLAYLVRLYTLWRTIDNQSQTGCQQVPCREENDECNDEADDGVNDVPTSPGNDDT